MKLIRNPDSWRPHATPDRRQSRIDELFELVVHWDLKSIGQSIVHVGHANDAHQLAEHSVGHAFVDGGHAVRRDAVLASIRDADGEINQFPHEGIQFTRPAHHILQRVPGPRQCRRMIRDDLPEIIDFVSLASRANVIINLAHESRAFLIFDEWLNRNSPSK